MLTNRDSSVSATCYGCAEDIGVGAVVIAKLKLRNIERHVFAADLWNVPTTPRLKIDQKPSIV
jgi:hypothetical protein